MFLYYLFLLHGGYRNWKERSFGIRLIIHNSLLPISLKVCWVMLSLRSRIWISLYYMPLIAKCIIEGHVCCLVNFLHSIMSKLSRKPGMIIIFGTCPVEKYYRCYVQFLPAIGIAVKPEIAGRVRGIDSCWIFSIWNIWSGTLPFSILYCGD